MNIRRIATYLTILLPLVLTSCQKKILREDIAEFIANFSLENAINEYKRVNFSKIQTIKNGEEITLKKEIINFDVSDVSYPVYQRSYQEVKNEVEIDSLEEHFEITDNQYYLVINDKKEESTLEGLHNIIQQFFYKEVSLNGQYHSEGYYYGDIVSYSAYDYQNNITIDNESELLIFSECQNYQGTMRCSYFQVDKTGMMIKNIASGLQDDKEAKTEIEILKN